MATMKVQHQGGATPNTTEIIWGNMYVALRVRVTPGFAIFKFLNLRGEILRRVHLILLPATSSDVTILTALHPFELPPFETTNLPVAYSAVGPSDYKVIVIFSNSSGETFMIRESVYLPASGDSVFHLQKTWKMVKPALGNTLTLPERDYTPAEAVSAVSSALKTRFSTIDSPVKEGSMWWSVNPVAIIEVPMNGDMTIWLSNGGDMDLPFISRNLAGMIGKQDQDFLLGVRLGKALITLQDYAELGWKASDAASLISQIRQVLGVMKMPIPSGCNALISGLQSAVSLKDLSPSKRDQFERFMQEVNRLCCGTTLLS